VIVTAPTKVKSGCDLQLPSMATLTSKTSSQAFFLRILKVIVQIRESVRLARRRNGDNRGKASHFDLTFKPYGLKSKKKNFCWIA
jgi:E3 ubiquitin-protein ligase HUWE1